MLLPKNPTKSKSSFRISDSEAKSYALACQDKDMQAFVRHIKSLSCFRAYFVAGFRPSFDLDSLIKLIYEALDAARSNNNTAIFTLPNYGQKSAKEIVELFELHSFLSS